jgi:hypothetical protein
MISIPYVTSSFHLSVDCGLAITTISREKASSRNKKPKWRSQLREFELLWKKDFESDTFKEDFVRPFL